MITSYKWLQTYFKEELPKTEDLVEILTLGAFEVEKVEQVGEDFTLDIDVLPNRAHDCLSHRGIAREIGVLLDLPIIEDKNENKISRTDTTLSVDVKEQILCRRYIGTTIKNIKVGPSPDWLKERLEGIGQKSINNIVDATNFIMFDLGQPLHAFDLDKVDGGIVVRKANRDEEITTLTGDEVTLNENNIVIADEKGALAVAGVKGGTKAEVDDNTTSIVLEAANFNPVSTRKTSRALNILTDSSKRFENELTPELAGEAMERLVSLVVDIAGGGDTSIESSVDVYPQPAVPYKVGVTVSDINNLLGTNIAKKDIENVWNKLNFGYEFVVPINKIKETIDSGEILGKRYVSGASVLYGAPEIFDCSSLSAWLFKESGIAIPRISVDQFVFSERIEKDSLEFGDLVFSNTGLVVKTGIHKKSIEFLPGTEVPSGVDHLGVFLGDGKVLHTSSQGEKVVVEDLDDAEMFKNIVGYGRINGINDERFVVTIPAERLDLRIKEDLIEEVARVYGYTNIKPELPKLDIKPLVNKHFYYINKIRDILTKEGFSEVYNYTFTDSGEVEVAHPIAKGKEFLRTNLTNTLSDRLLFNEKNAPLLGIDTIRLFEFGNVFKDGGESTHLAIGIRNAKKEKTKESDKIADIQDLFSRELGIDIVGEVNEGKSGGVVWELDLTSLIKELPQTENYDDVLVGEENNFVYKAFSQYPFMLRDIAVWTPVETKEEDVLKVIVENAGDLLVQKKLFDRFEKPARTGEAGGEGRVSYAFNLVFQSSESTLTDDEINKIMDTITSAMQDNKWEVR